jgi:tetratricopeptide (TPR) repeat protein
MWLLRARRLARIHHNEPEFAQAHLGLGSIAADLGLLDQAIEHATKAFRAALRCGQHRLAGWAYHDLLLLKIGLGRYEEAWAHALDAISLYKRDHPRLPALAHDIALLWSRQGYYSAAMTVFEHVMPHVRRPHEKMLILSNFARAAAACGDRLRYERSMLAVEKVRRECGTIPASVWVHLAHAAQTANDWLRADELIQVSLEKSHSGYLDLSRELAVQIASRSGGDVDILPDLGSDIDRVRDLLIQRLRKHTVPGFGPGTVPPEKFPLD